MNGITSETFHVSTTKNNPVALLVSMHCGSFYCQVS